MKHKIYWVLGGVLLCLTVFLLLAQTYYSERINYSRKQSDGFESISHGSAGPESCSGIGLSIPHPNGWPDKICFGKVKYNR